MNSVPYSKYILYPISWYSFLILIGALFAVVLSCREERRLGLPKDTVIDLALLIIPFGIIGARIYYVLFSWNLFRNDPISVFRIWEGGLAIYGGVIAGLIVLFLFARKRSIPPLKLCDLIAPGLVLAQSIGRWGNWFNTEAYGISITAESLCFFPLAVQIPSDGFSWHLATFFYESLWDFSVFIFLTFFRRRHSVKTGDVFFFYLFLYAAARLVIEEMRLDSLYASSSVRISQLLSVMTCIAVLIRYTVSALRYSTLSAGIRLFLLPFSAGFSLFTLLYTLSGSFFPFMRGSLIFLILCTYALLMIISFFSVYFLGVSREVPDADNHT